MNSTLYRHLGAHVDVVDGIAGTRFAVWAPNAREVSVLCDHNSWTHGRDWLNSSDNGVWWGFIPGVNAGAPYKFGIRTPAGHLVQKCDPYAFFSEVPPKSASVVYDLSGYAWQDDGWLRKRDATNWYEHPVAIYEVNLGSWKKPKDGRQYYTYRELAPMLVDYVTKLGYSHIELMPITEHPFDGSWGYQTTGYFAPTSRFGDPHDLMYFIDYCHQAGLGVIVDWVPAHFPTDGHSLGGFDGTCCYEHSDPRQGFHPDWGTLIFNYGRAEVRDFLLSSARFWIDEYHMDGLRVDAVASMLYLDYSRKPGEWVPNAFGGRENLEAIQFLKDMNVELHRDFPGVLTLAEESTAWGGVSRPVYTGGLGFGMKWDMGWMNDTLRYLRHEPVHRAYHQNELSFRMVYAFTENFILPLSHDEVVHGKKSLLSQMPGDYWQQFGNLRLLYGYQYTMPGKKLLFMGCEIGQWTEWNHQTELDWALVGQQYHDGVHQLVTDLNALYRREPALHQMDMLSEGFRWISCDDWQNSVYAYIRYAKNQQDFVVVVMNMTPVPRHNYRVGVPKPGFYSEIMNTDAGIYGGSNLGNAGGVYSEIGAMHGHGQNISLTLPPLGMLALKPVVGPKTSAASTKPVTK
ncbi:MAG: 1,4-alpha-glucan branching protein GlgB [Planctomycetaceae bacterium]|nr:1,4-alpha-glucan branching protein GlgB [Planctomycetaceae bacterium]